MLIKPHIIGFFGTESYDFILYLAKYLVIIGQKVLITDNAKLGGLSYCIPVPISLNPKKDLITFNNIDFFKFDRNLIDKKKYDYILIDFGWDTNHENTKECDNLYFITDLQQQYMEHILNTKIYNASAYILLKNYFHTNNIQTIKDYFKEKCFEIKDCYLLPTTQRDLENMVMIQYSNEINLKKISKPIKNLIYTIFTENLNLEEKMIQKIISRSKS